MLTTTACRITILFILFSFCFFLTFYGRTRVPPLNGFGAGTGEPVKGWPKTILPISKMRHTTRSSHKKMNLKGSSRSRALSVAPTSAMSTPTAPMPPIIVKATSKAIVSL